VWGVTSAMQADTLSAPPTSLTPSTELN
jgi:hypothetical protein